MGSFSLYKLKDSLMRRLSEPLLSLILPTGQFLSTPVERRNSNAAIFSVDSVNSDSLSAVMRRAELVERMLNRLRSRSVSKKEAKKLIRQETSYVILRKLMHILQDSGVHMPISLDTTVTGTSASSSLKVHIANSSDCVYLPAARSNVSILDEGEPEPDENLSADLQDTEAIVPEGGSGANLQERSRDFTSSNYLISDIDAESLIPHLFAVIIEVENENLQLGSIRVELLSQVETEWIDQANGSIFPQRELYSIASHTWNLNLDEADYFISNVNSNDRSDKRTTSEDLAKRNVFYRLNEPLDIRNGPEIAPNSVLHDHKAGLYLFLLPIILPSNIPATVRSIHGSLKHQLSIETPIENPHLLRKGAAKATYELPMVRTPPSLANSISDKPIHISRVWNDALHYTITFPRKYVSLGSEHIINVKLIPMVKNVVLKRVKFNILERTTYLSLDSREAYEYEGVSNCVSKMRGLKPRDRVIPLCELRTKEKKPNYTIAEPFKSEVIKCKDNNLLNACYETSSKSQDSDEVFISSPVDVNVALPFLTSTADKVLLTSSSDLKRSRSIDMSSRNNSVSKADLDLNPEVISSPVMGSLETQVIHQGSPSATSKRSNIKVNSSSFASATDINISEGSTVASKALSPDSNFKHIQISHRLQVAFRVSKPDMKDRGKIHHYEIVVDTPLVLLSSKCNEASVQLPHYEAQSAALETMPMADRDVSFRIPQYNNNGVSIRQLSFEDEERLPSFEEAVSGTPSPRRKLSLPSDNQVPSFNLDTFKDPAPAYNSRAPSYRARPSLSPLSYDRLGANELAMRSRQQSSTSSSDLSSFELSGMSRGETLSSLESLLEQPANKVSIDTALCENFQGINCHT